MRLVLAGAGHAHAEVLRRFARDRVHALELVLVPENPLPKSGIYAVRMGMALEAAHRPALFVALQQELIAWNPSAQAREASCATRSRGR